MTKRRLVFWSVGLAAGLIALPFLLWGGYAAFGVLHGEHFYRGLPTSHWRRYILRQPKPLTPARDRVLAIEAVRSVEDYFGLGEVSGDPAGLSTNPAAIPVLMDLLRDSDREVRRWAANALRCIGPAAERAVPALVEALRDRDAAVAEAAAAALGEIGPRALPAIPALIETFLDGEHPMGGVQEALVRIGPAAFPLLTQALSHPHVYVRGRVAVAARMMGPAALPLAPALIKLLADDNEVARSYAADALAKIGPAVLPLLAEALHGQAGRLRTGAAFAIGRMDLELESNEAKPLLEEALRHQDKEVRQAAAQPLQNILPGLGRRLHDK
jgi:HEAT repeat protein